MSPRTAAGDTGVTAEALRAHFRAMVRANGSITFSIT